jgi:hypothetical protein
LRLKTLTCAGLLAVACQKTSFDDSGVVVVVLTDASVKADCIGVAAIKTSAGSTEQLTTLAKRAAHLEFGVGTGPGLDGEISLVARGFLGGDCSTPGVLNAQSNPLIFTFKQGSVGEKVTLMLTGALDDDDGDGYRAANKGGTDCDPSNPNINPGEVENCADGIDNDCSGLADCADRASCEGHACDDHNACSTGETCVNAVCTPAQPPCLSPPNGCYASAGCDAGTCVYTVTLGAPCDGGTCRADSVCVSGETLCGDHIDNDNNGATDCADLACANQPCDDGNGCTVNDTCAMGSCVGQARVCNTPPTSPCFVQDAGTCSANDCHYTPRPGRSCDDGMACTVGDTCAADGSCLGTPKICTGVYDGGCSATSGTCNPADGSCTFDNAAVGTSCNDQNACTTMDSCSATGVCAGTQMPCGAPQCKVAVGCLAGMCMFTNVDAGTVCDGGFCLAGACSAFPYVPSNFDPSIIAASDWSPTIHLVGICTLTFDSSGITQYSGDCVGLATLPTPKQVTLADGNPAVLLPFGGLIIDGLSNLALIGDKPVILAVKGDATVSGLITASSQLGQPGAGSDAAGCSLGAAGVGGSVTIPGGKMSAGGGGGAFATSGSPGAETADGGVPGSGGMPTGGASLVPLRGGCAGGAGGPSGNNTACAPGAGGGAVQLSVAGALTVSGNIAASGAGGPAGTNASSNPNSGGGGACGGGSGGGILLEGRTVNLATGSLLTNGGAGGEGGTLTALGNDGASGSTSNATPAAGGDFGNQYGGKGGDGAAGKVGGSFTAAGAAVPGNNVGGGGGGGGGVGRIRVNASVSCTGPTTVSGDISFSMSCP